MQLKSKWHQHRQQISEETTISNLNAALLHNGVVINLELREPGLQLFQVLDLVHIEPVDLLDFPLPFRHVLDME